MSTSQLRITRQPDLPVLAGVYLSGFASIRDLLQSSLVNPDWVMADLSLGAWESHRVAKDFFAQLGLPFHLPQAAGDNLAKTSNVLPSYADLVGMGIDAEAGGDRNCILALEWATTLVKHVSQNSPCTFLVFAPRFNLAWETENILFIRFLLQGLIGSDSRILLVNADTSPGGLPPGWKINWLNSAPASEPLLAGSMGLAGLVPGLLDPQIARTLEEGGTGAGINRVILADGRWLLNPAARPDPAGISRFQYDHLAAQTKYWGWLHAYAQFGGNNLYVDPLFLCQQAWRQFIEGGTGIALRLMERALDCARSTGQQGIIQAQVQGIRIALQRYGEVAACAEPSPALPWQLRSFLLEAKGWGLVMANQPDKGEPYLAEARNVLQARPDEREYLYLLNISALGRLKSGDLAGALALEHTIEVEVLGLASPDYRLGYVNFINLARLYRRLGDYGRAEDYYRKAFATTLGLRSETDFININLTLALLNEERQQPEEALQCWLRTALHWLSSEVPEALTPRAAAILVKRESGGTGFFDPEKFSAAIYTRLVNAARRSKIPAIVRALENLPGEIYSPVFCRVSRLEERTAIKGAAGTAGLSIIASAEQIPVGFSGNESLRLRGLVYHLLRAIQPDTLLAQVQTLAIDDRLGQEIPATASELLESCLRLGINRLIFDSQTYQLSNSEKVPMQSECTVQLANGVQSLHKAEDYIKVSFKRYRPAEVFTGQAANILERLAKGPVSYRELDYYPGPVASLTLLRSLELERVVYLDLGEEANVLQRLVSGRV